MSTLCSGELKRKRKSIKRKTKHEKKEKENAYKRAQRALSRSPEEKVKGHSGAIYRGPLMLSTKYW